MDFRQLIKECRKGSTAAQKFLFDNMAGPMLSICRRYIKNPEDSEEIMLDGFFRFFKTLPSFQYHNEAALFAWVKRIMINECLMFLRRRNAFTMSLESEIEETPLPEQTFDKLEAKDIMALIVQLLVGYRTVFNLYAVEGMGHKEIAQLLGITEGTSKSQLSKARQLLQKLLVQQNEEYANRKAR